MSDLPGDYYDQQDMMILVGQSDFEYWCKRCRQLRLWVASDRPFKCGNCGSTDVVKGAPGELDQNSLETFYPAGNPAQQHGADMTFDLSSIKKSTQLPPRICCYGVQGIGKTTFASKMPKPVFLPVEDGLGQLEVEAFPRPTSYDEVKDAIDTLIKGEHDYQTFVIDSADKLEPMIWDHVCEHVTGDKGRKCERIEDYGYGKGYTHALTEWRHILAGLDFLREERDMAICVIAHSQIVKFEAPDTDPYDRYQLRLHKVATAAVCDWADAVLFANYEVTTIAKGGDSDKRRGIGKGERSLFTTERPAFLAKNRYSMDDKLPLAWPDVEKFILPPKPEPKSKKKSSKKAAAKA